MPMETLSPTPTTPTVRLLPPEEWDRLASIPPFDSGLPDPTHWRILVAEAAGEIVGFVCLFEAVHLEPLWVAPEYRAKPHLFGQVLGDLWQASRTVLEEAGVGVVFAVVDNTLLPRGGQFVEHLGFTPAEGKL